MSDGHREQSKGTHAEPLSVTSTATASARASPKRKLADEEQTEQPKCARIANDQGFASPMHVQAREAKLVASDSSKLETASAIKSGNELGLVLELLFDSHERQRTFQFRMFGGRGDSPPLHPVDIVDELAAKAAVGDQRYAAILCCLLAHCHRIEWRAILECHERCHLSESTQGTLDTVMSAFVCAFIAREQQKTFHVPDWQFIQLFTCLLKEGVAPCVRDFGHSLLGNAEVRKAYTDELFDSGFFIDDLSILSADAPLSRVEGAKEMAPAQFRAIKQREGCILLLCFQSGARSLAQLVCDYLLFSDWWKLFEVSDHGLNPTPSFEQHPVPATEIVDDDDHAEAFD